MAIERKTLLMRSTVDCPVRARHIDGRRADLGLSRADWPKVNGQPHLRMTPSEKVFVFREVRG
jgi:hypothetical protein